MLSLLLSFVLYGHTLNAAQTVGLALSLAAMIANFYEKGGNKKHGEKSQDKKEALPHENVHLLGAEPSDTEDIELSSHVRLEVETKNDKDLTSSLSSSGTQNNDTSELITDVPLAEVDLVTFADDGKQPDYLDLPLAKDERHISSV